MAELIISEEERRTASFLEWDNESLGRSVKKLALNFKDKDGKTSLKITSAAVILIAEAIQAGSEATDIELTDARKGDEHLGNWIIKLTKLP